MKYVMFYESADNMLAKVRRFFPPYQAYWAKFVAEGALLMNGTFARPQEEGSMGIFTIREATEQFARSDPFVLNGIVKKWYIREWNEVLMKP